MYNIVHSGDLKYGFTRLWTRRTPEYPRVDALFIESTYGGPGTSRRTGSTPRRSSWT